MGLPLNSSAFADRNTIQFDETNRTWARKTKIEKMTSFLAGRANDLVQGEHCNIDEMEDFEKRKAYLTLLLKSLPVFLRNDKMQIGELILKCGKNAFPFDFQEEKDFLNKGIIDGIVSYGDIQNVFEDYIRNRYEIIIKNIFSEIANFEQFSDESKKFLAFCLQNGYIKDLDLYYLDESIKKYSLPSRLDFKEKYYDENLLDDSISRIFDLFGISLPKKIG